MTKSLKKMVLVPIEEWEQIQDKSSELQNLTPKKIVTVNQNMNFHPMKETEKMEETKKEMKKKIQINSLPEKKQIHPLQKHKQIGEGEIFKKGKRSNALLRFLQKKKNITWDKKGQIKFEGIRIPNSHITKLIIHATSQDNSNPTGLNAFYRALYELHVPDKLIKNNMGIKILNDLKKNHNKWRPPGKMS